MPQPTQKTVKGTATVAEQDVSSGAKRLSEKPTTRTVPVKLTKKKVLAERPVKYPYYKAMICCLDNPAHVDEKGKQVEYDGPITVEIAKQLLGWETEPDYVKRKLAEDPNYKESKLKFGGEYLLKDADGNKVICWNNCTNRPLTESHAASLAQDILTKNWRMNLENIIVSKTGLVLSGQHRLIGLILAVEGKDGWRKQQHWQQVWDEEPIIETMVAFGCEETPEVLRTLDNVKPRELDDVFYTSPLFADKTTEARREMSRALKYAVELLWKRTRGDGDKFIEHQTHSASIDFLDRHPKLLAAVKHIYDEDGGKVIDVDKDEEFVGKAISSGLRLQRGHAAALLYLMGQSRTKDAVSEDYYLPGAVQSEKRLDWTCWEMALQFWTDLGEQKLEWAQTVKEALACLNDPDKGFSANNREKHAVIVNAWTKYRIKEKFQYDKPEKLHPEFTIDEMTNRRKISAENEPVLGGIDRGTLDIADVDESGLTEEQAEENKEKARVEKIKNTLDKGKPPIVKMDPDKKVLPNSGKPKTPSKNGPAIGKPALKGGTSEENLPY